MPEYITAKEIGKRLGVSTRTVNTYLKRYAEHLEPIKIGLQMQIESSQFQTLVELLRVKK